MVRLLVSLCAATLLSATAAEAQQAQIPFKVQSAGGWLIYASFNYCTMMHDVERGTPDDRVTFSLTYFPDRNISMIHMSSGIWRALSSRNGKDIPATFHFDGATLDTAGSASVYAAPGITPSFMLSVDERMTTTLLETLRRSKTMTATADGRSLGPYDLGTVPEGLDKLMECVAAARQVMSKDPFR